MTRQPRVVYWVVFLDALLMFAIVPLLPGYVRDLHLTKTEAGLIVGIYSGAVLVGSVPVGYLAARVGARRLTIFGVALLAVATFGCGFAGGFWPLMAARIGQGLSSAVSWTAGMAWLSEGTPPQSRGRVLGTAMSFATVGTLIGPVAGGVLGGAYGSAHAVHTPRLRRGRADRGRRARPRRSAGRATGGLREPAACGRCAVAAW